MYRLFRILLKKTFTLFLHKLVQCFDDGMVKALHYKVAGCGFESGIQLYLWDSFP